MPMDVMVLRYSDGNGQQTIALNRETTSIGRSPDQHIVLHDRGVSRCHAIILRAGSVYSVVDQQSTHGTFLNGARIKRAVLKSGDLLQLGSLNAPALHFQTNSVSTSAAHSSVSTL